MKYNYCIAGLLLCCATASGQIITTFAGDGTNAYGGDGGPATAAQLWRNYSIAADKRNNLYLADSSFHIRKVNTSDTINTFAGTGTAGFSGDGGPASAAQIRYIAALTIDGRGNMYFNDGANYRIRKIDSAGIITTIAGTGTAGFSGDGGAATAARINGNSKIAIDNSGNLYFSDGVTNRVRKIDASTGIINTFAGTGVSGFSGDGGAATAAKLQQPAGIYIDQADNLYIIDYRNFRVRKVNTSGIISTICGTGTAGFSGDGGPATAAQISVSSDITGDGCGNLYISTAGGINRPIRKINAAGIITTIAGGTGSGYSGDGGPATAAKFISPAQIAFDHRGYFYIADPSINRIRRISNINYFPSFTRGAATYLTLCESSSASVDSLLPVIDADSFQTESWSLLTAPLHGTASVAYSATSMATTLATSGLTYTPATGYSGADTFAVLVTDCGGLSDTIMVYVTVRPLPSAGIISGPSAVCRGDSVALSVSATGGSWSATNTFATVSGTGMVRGISIGTDTIMYMVSNSCGTDTALHTTTVGSLTLTVTPSGPTTFCAGNNVVLQSDTGTGYVYQWYNGTTAISGATNSAYTATATGTYKVTINTAAGCSGTSSITTVTVNPLPTVTVTPSAPLTFCPGGNVTFNAAASSACTWQWLNGSLAITGATLSYYTATAAGVYKVVATNAAGCRDTSAAYTVTLYSVPTAAIIPAVSVGICYGDTATLTATSGSGYTYQWYMGTSPISGATNTTYRTTTLANFHVRVTNTTGCVANSPATAVVYSGPAAAITGSTLFCAGGTTLHATTGAGYTWQWYNGSTPITGATTANYYVTVTGAYKVKVTNSTGCASMSAPVTSTDILLPYVVAGGPTTFCHGGSVLLTINTSGTTGSAPVIYQWKRNLVNITGATTGSHTATTGGSYTCYENIGGSCIATTPAVVVSVSDCGLAVGNQQSAVSSPRVYPNPASKELIIEVGPAFAKAMAGEGCDVVICDVVGREVLQPRKGCNMIAMGAALRLDISDLPNGIYFVRIVDNITGTKTVQKLLKE